jgi:hypothetical protein
MLSERNAEPRAYWPGWAEFLRRHGLEDLAVWVLEAAGPLAVFGAQVLYFGGPFFRPGLKNAAVNGLADILEDEDERHSFVKFLREDGKA